MTSETQKTQTRQALIAAGLHLFGHQGYAATSTRELAGRAQTNIASIAYHFGGKSGLHQACAREVANLITTAVGTMGAGGIPATPQEAQDRIEAMFRAIVMLLVGAPKAADMVAFMMRELTTPGEVVDLIFDEFLEPRHKDMCSLWASATGRDADDEEVKLVIFSMLGQVIYFRIARPFVERRMGWDGIDQTETRKIADMIIANLRATLERQRL